MSLDWDEVIAFGLTLPGVTCESYYGEPALKAANGRAFVSPGHEKDTSFCLQIDRDTIAVLMETDPDTYWQSPHYAGSSAVLVRFDTHDPDRVRTMIERSRDWAASRPKPRPRRKT